MKLYPLKMVPFYQPRPWGGRRMHQVLGKDIPDGPIGESWEVSPHPNGLSHVANGPLEGLSLVELTTRFGADLLGKHVHDRYGSTFPLLIKIIDVHTLASVQVHPNDEQAQALENAPQGKTEAWYLIDRTDEAEFYAGFKPHVTPQVFTDALADGSVKQLLEPVDLQPGQCLYVPPGTVHACGNGVFMLEVQQCCDLTYRVYDWDRTDAEGAKRELHIDKALQVIDFAARPVVFEACGGGAVAPILTCEQFSIYQCTVTERLDLPGAAAFAAGTVIAGQAVLTSDGADLSVGIGDSFLVPAATPVAVESPQCTMVLSTVSA